MELHEFCDICVSGHDPYRFVNALRNSPVICTDQRCIRETFYGKVLRRDLNELERIAHGCCMEVIVQERHSVKRKLRRYRLRFGLLTGLVLGAVLILWQSNIVETIEIQGASAVDERVILAILEEEGVRRGTWIREIDMLHCENRLRTSVPDVAWAGLRHTGNRLVVQIAEVRPNVPMLYERVPSNIIAKHGAQITGVRVYAGTLMHILGDGVEQGELLVSGVRTDDHGHTTFLHANAEITGIYTREAELTQYFRQTEITKTGRMFQKRTLRVFGLMLPLTAGDHGFTSFQVTHADTPVCFLKFRLPCSVLCDTYVETAAEEIVQTEDEARLALHEDIVRFEKNLLQDVTILDREITYRTTENSLTANLRYTVEGEIGEQSEIFLIP